MKTINELAREHNMSYSGMHRRIRSIIKYLREKGDERAERFVRISELRFSRGKAKLLVDEQIFNQVLQEAQVE
jgi:hypothetical protein